jgi:hypothetical protein
MLLLDAMADAGPPFSHEPPTGTVSTPLLLAVSAPLLPSSSVPVRGFRNPGNRRPRTHSGAERPGIEPRTTSALVSGVGLG